MHLHQPFIDGTYELGPQNQPIDFWAGGKPEVSEINEVLMLIIDKLIRYLEKQGIIRKDQTKDQEQEFQLPISDEDVFAKLQASSITYRFATGKSKGKDAIVLKALDDGDHNSPSGLVAEHSGWWVGLGYPRPPRRSGRAQLRHPAPRIVVSLHDSTSNAESLVAAAGIWINSC